MKINTLIVLAVASSISTVASAQSPLSNTSNNLTRNFLTKSDIQSLNAASKQGPGQQMPTNLPDNTNTQPTVVPNATGNSVGTTQQGQAAPQQAQATQPAVVQQPTQALPVSKPAPAAPKTPTEVPMNQMFEGYNWNESSVKHFEDQGRYQDYDNAQTFYTGPSFQPRADQSPNYKHELMTYIQLARNSGFSERRIQLELARLSSADFIAWAQRSSKER